MGEQENGGLDIRVIEWENRQDACLQNEPFTLFGRVTPSYTDGRWDYALVRFPEGDKREMRFPDERYDDADMWKTHTFVGAYDGAKCVALAVLRPGFFKYMYLHDLKVNRAYRHRGVGAALIKTCGQIAAQRGDLGIYTIGQDDNAGACLFYLRMGFKIGGLDTRVYEGTPQAGKSDILFYLDCADGMKTGENA